jgi:hypothetical protein
VAAQESDAGGTLLRVELHANLREPRGIPDRRRSSLATCGSRAQCSYARNREESPQGGTPGQPDSASPAPVFDL